MNSVEKYKRQLIWFIRNLDKWERGDKYWNAFTENAKKPEVKKFIKKKTKEDTETNNEECREFLKQERIDFKLGISECNIKED